MRASTPTRSLEVPETSRMKALLASWSRLEVDLESSLDVHQIQRVHVDVGDGCCDVLFRSGGGEPWLTWANVKGVYRPVSAVSLIVFAAARITQRDRRAESDRRRIDRWVVRFPPSCRFGTMNALSDVDQGLIGVDHPLRVDAL